jgi:CHAT domain-containing protein/tetratricopeptide (TPR) repeat protein
MTLKLIDDLQAAEQERNPEKIIEILRQLLSIAQQQENKILEIETLRRLGNVFQDGGQLQKSHAYRVTAEKLVKEMGQDCPIEVQMMVEGDLGRSYIEAHDWKKAEEFTSRALAKAEAQNHAEGLRIFKINLSVILANTGKAQEAIALGKQVLALPTSQGNHYSLGLQHLNLAVLMLKALQLNDSQRHARNALAHAELSGNTQLRTQAQEILGESFRYAQMLTGNYEYSREAEHHLQEAAENARSQQNYFVLANAELTLAELDESRRNFEGAGEHYQGAMNALEQVRRSLGYAEMQGTYFASIQATYDKATEFMLRQGQIDLAFKTAEQSRSRILLAMLGHRKRSTRSWFADEQETLRRHLDRYGEARMLMRAEEVDDARQKILRLYESKQSHTANWQAWESHPIGGVPEIRKFLSDEDAMLTYVVARDAIIVFVITSEGRYFQHLNYPEQKLAADVEALRVSMSFLHGLALAGNEQLPRQPTDPRPRVVTEQLETVNQQLEKLFTILLAPVLSVIHDKSHWVIVPHGSLHRVPWSALRFAGSYLIERHSISLLPSASLGVALGSRQAPPLGEALLFADPDPEHPDLQLPGSQREVEQASRALGEGQIFIGAAATKHVLFERASKARLLHFACHHEFDEITPILSFLKLAGSSGSDFVYSFELDEIDLVAELVTLSACETGLSKLGSGDEQYGIVRAFLAAGARSVLSTLWRIDDNSAAELFSHFYIAARQEGLAKALASSQKRLLRSAQYSLPNFWAPYVLSGGWHKSLSGL